MKCRIYVIFTVIIGLVFSTSCTQEEVLNLDEYKDDYSYGLQVFDMSMEMLPNAIDEFSTDKDRIIKFYNLTDHQTDYTFFVTLNGYLCPIIVNGEDAGIYYNSSAESNTVAEMEINIQLKEELLLSELNYLVFTVITENQIVPEQNSHMIFNIVSFAHQLIVPDAIQIGANAFTINDADYYHKSDELNERYGIYQFATLQDIETKRYEMISDWSLQLNADKRKLRVEAVGDKGVYSLLLFCNDKPIYLSKDKYNYIFTLSGDDMFSKEIEITVEDTEGTLYALIFPLESDNYMPFLTDKVNFETD